MIDIEILALAIAFGFVPVAFSSKGHYLLLREASRPGGSVEVSIQDRIIGVLWLSIIPAVLYPSLEVFLASLYVVSGLSFLNKEFRSYAYNSGWFKKMFVTYVALQASYLAWLQGGTIPPIVSYLGLPGLFAIITRYYFQRDVVAANKLSQPRPQSGPAAH